jgi:hypothetical protein
LCGIAGTPYHSAYHSSCCQLWCLIGLLNGGDEMVMVFPSDQSYMIQETQNVEAILQPGVYKVARIPAAELRQHMWGITQVVVPHIETNTHPS